jgi:hypothetical protein
MYYCTHILYFYCTPTADDFASDGGVDSASDDAIGAIKRKRPKKGKKKKGKGKARARNVESEDDADDSDSDGPGVAPKKARGRYDLPRAPRGASTHASYNYGDDDADSTYTPSVAASNYSD